MLMELLMLIELLMLTELLSDELCDDNADIRAIVTWLVK